MKGFGLPEIIVGLALVTMMIYALGGFSQGLLSGIKGADKEEGIRLASYALAVVYSQPYRADGAYDLSQVPIPPGWVVSLEVVPLLNAGTQKVSVAAQYSLTGEVIRLEVIKALLP